MAKDVYPNTTHQPIQRLDFKLSNGDLVRAIFSPQPDATGSKVDHVDLKVAAAGSTLYVPLGNGNISRTMSHAVNDAYRYAQNQAMLLKANIVEARLEGVEFLEKADIDQVTGKSIPVLSV